MPRILIAGCGYVGQATGDLFHAAGWAVEGWTHSAKSAARLSAKPYPVYGVDIADRAQIRARAPAAAGFDAIIHCASSSVYAQCDGSWVTEESETNPAREEGRILLETEDLVLGDGGIVARLGGIYGPGRSALLTKCIGMISQPHFFSC